MRFALVRTAIQELGLTVTQTAGEYRVAPLMIRLAAIHPGWTFESLRLKAEEMAYYTDDPIDALATARSMAKELGIA